MNFRDAKWISYIDNFDRNIIYFKKDFYVGKNVEKAELYISGLGFYDFKINNIVPKQGLFKPNISDYKKRESSSLINKENKYFAYYDKYNITDYLTNNSINELFVRVGTGYFHINDKMDFIDYGKSRLIYLIKLVYKDKSVSYVVSDESTLSMKSINKSSLYLGDDINFNDEKDDYHNSVIINEKISLKKEEGSIDKIFKKIPGKIIHQSPKRVILDFGINHSGNPSIYIQGKKNSKITVKYAEVLNEDGSLNLTSGSYYGKEEKIHIDQINYYVLSGNKDYLETYFSYRCYRYIEISSEDDFTIGNLYSNFIHGNIKQDLFLKCDNKVINDLFNKYILTQFDNFHSGMSMDCPHREKLPYTGDTSLVRNNLLYFFDYEKQMYKFLKDIYASQGKDGFIPYTVPDFFAGGGYFWSLSIATIPLSLFERTGKLIYLKDSLPYLEKFVNYFSHHLDDKGAVKSNDKAWILGDWLSPETTEVDVSFFSTVCYFLAIKYLIEFKKQLNIVIRNDELDLLSKVKKVIINNYYNEDSHTFSLDKQGETVLGAYLNIVKDPQIKKSIENHYKKYPYFDTGIIMTPILVRYMLTNDLDDLLFNVLNRKESPSYYYMMENETTLSEHWTKKWPPFKTNNSGEYIQLSGDTSHCHPMFGSILYDVVKYIIGLDLSDIKNNYIHYEYKAKFNIKNIDIKYKHNRIILKNNTLTINVDNGYQIEFNGKIYKSGKHIINIGNILV